MVLEFYESAVISDPYLEGRIKETYQLPSELNLALGLQHIGYDKPRIPRDLLAKAKQEEREKTSEGPLPNPDWEVGKKISVEWGTATDGQKQTWLTAPDGTKALVVAHPKIKSIADVEFEIIANQVVGEGFLLFVAPVSEKKELEKPQVITPNLSSMTRTNHNHPNSYPYGSWETKVVYLDAEYTTRRVPQEVKKTWYQEQVVGLIKGKSKNGKTLFIKPLAKVSDFESPPVAEAYCLVLTSQGSPCVTYQEKGKVKQHDLLANQPAPDSWSTQMKDWLNSNEIKKWIDICKEKIEEYETAKKTALETMEKGEKEKIQEIFNTYLTKRQANPFCSHQETLSFQGLNINLHFQPYLGQRQVGFIVEADFVNRNYLNQITDEYRKSKVKNENEAVVANCKKLIEKIIDEQDWQLIAHRNPYFVMKTTVDGEPDQQYCPLKSINGIRNLQEQYPEVIFISRGDAVQVAIKDETTKETSIILGKVPLELEQVLAAPNTSWQLSSDTAYPENGSGWLLVKGLFEVPIVEGHTLVREMEFYVPQDPTGKARFQRLKIGQPPNEKWLSPIDFQDNQSLLASVVKSLKQAQKDYQERQHVNRQLEILTNLAAKATEGDISDLLEKVLQTIDNDLNLIFVENRKFNLNPNSLTRLKKLVQALLAIAQPKNWSDPHFMRLIKKGAITTVRIGNLDIPVKQYRDRTVEGLLDCGAGGRSLVAEDFIEHARFLRSNHDYLDEQALPKVLLNKADKQVWLRLKKKKFNLGIGARYRTEKSYNSYRDPDDGVQTEKIVNRFKIGTLNRDQTNIDQTIEEVAVMLKVVDHLIKKGEMEAYDPQSGYDLRSNLQNLLHYLTQVFYYNEKQKYEETVRASERANVARLLVLEINQITNLVNNIQNENENEPAQEPDPLKDLSKAMGIIVDRVINQLDSYGSDGQDSHQNSLPVLNEDLSPQDFKGWLNNYWQALVGQVNDRLIQTIHQARQEGYSDQKIVEVIGLDSSLVQDTEFGSWPIEKPTGLALWPNNLKTLWQSGYDSLQHKLVYQSKLNPLQQPLAKETTQFDIKVDNISLTLRNGTGADDQVVPAVLTRWQNEFLREGQRFLEKLPNPEYWLTKLREKKEATLERGNELGELAQSTTDKQFKKIIDIYLIKLREPVAEFIKKPEYRGPEVVSLRPNRSLKPVTSDHEALEHSKTLKGKLSYNYAELIVALKTLPAIKELWTPDQSPESTKPTELSSKTAQYLERAKDDQPTTSEELRFLLDEWTKIKDDLQTVLAKANIWQQELVSMQDFLTGLTQALEEKDEEWEENLEFLELDAVTANVYKLDKYLCDQKIVGDSYQELIDGWKPLAQEEFIRRVRNSCEMGSDSVDDINLLWQELQQEAIEHHKQHNQLPTY